MNIDKMFDLIMNYYLYCYNGTNVVFKESSSFSDTHCSIYRYDENSDLLQNAALRSVCVCVYIYITSKYIPTHIYI